jgi:hypothetical protein
MGATFFGIPELELEDKEAKALASAIGEVSKHYAIPGIRDDHAAIAGLLFVLFVTYGKRVVFIARGARADRGNIAAVSQVQPSSERPAAEVQTPWFDASVSPIQ